MNYSTIKRRKPLKKFSKQSTIIRACDKVFREIIRKRDNMTCQRCGRNYGKLEVSHFYSRALHNLRWDLDNVCMLCFKCHYLFGHQQPLEFAEFWEKRIGKEAMDRLRVKKNTIARPDYKLMYFKPTEYLKEMERESQVRYDKHPT